MTIPEQCLRCRHFQEEKPGMYCHAFPISPGIPHPILEMYHDHRLPYPGDHGIRWEPREPGIENPFEEDSQ